VFGSEKHRGAVVGREEAHAFLRHFGQLQEGHHLESAYRILALPPVPIVSSKQGDWRYNQPTTISQNIALPSLQHMRAANLVQHFLARLQAEMIGVVET
jgi:hypothetical protein